MDQIVDIQTVVTAEQMWVAIVLIIATLVVPQIVQLFQNRNIKAQLTPNHGSSARDAIDRIESALNSHIDSENAVTTGILERLDALDTPEEPSA